MVGMRHRRPGLHPRVILERTTQLDFFRLSKRARPRGWRLRQASGQSSHGIVWTNGLYPSRHMDRHPTHSRSLSQITPRGSPVDTGGFGGHAHSSL